MSALTFRKRPVEVQAMKWDGSYEQQGAIVTWSRGSVSGWFDGAYHLQVETLEGTMRADVGDYIIRGIQGEFYPCKPNIFEASYDEKAADVMTLRVDVTPGSPAPTFDAFTEGLPHGLSPQMFVLGCIEALERMLPDMG